MSLIRRRGVHAVRSEIAGRMLDGRLPPIAACDAR